MPEGRLKALVSIHDVMPETRSNVTHMLARLALPPECVTLLVVPGRDWKKDDLAWLKALQAAGHPLAGHGWSHQCQPPVTLYHKLHSLFLSRRVAEHLSFSADGIIRLVQDCHDWFARHDLHVSPLYVPPAWALGALPRDRYGELPFDYVETLSGVLDTRSGQLQKMPLVGYEADRWWRAWFLRHFNQRNTQRAITADLPLRIGLHPFDLELLLGSDIATLVSKSTLLPGYPQVMPSASPVQSCAR